MKPTRIPAENKIRTPHSQTTIYVNYSEKVKILEVAFTGGRVYHYYPVEPAVWEEYCNVIKEGGSSGTFVNTRIKPHYRVHEPDAY